MPHLKYKNSREEDERRHSSLILVVTRDCNLRCSYCYESINDCDRKHMDIAVAKEAIKNHLEKNDGQNSAVIDFFGGEPLIVSPLLKRIIEWFDKNSFKKKSIFLYQPMAQF